MKRIEKLEIENRVKEEMKRVDYDSQKMIEIVDEEIDKQKRNFEEKKEFFDNKRKLIFA
jgi:arginine decarboxylase-like protein